MTGSPLATPLAWDLVSAAYDAEVVPMFETYVREALRLAAPAPGSRVVDVACGPGTLAAIAARAGHRVDAIDFSPKMIAVLEGKRLDGVTAQIGDGQALPYADATFAAGFSMFGLMFFPDRARGFAELRRVLAPGARAVVSSWHPLDTVPAFGTIFGVLREMMPTRPGAPEPALTTAELCSSEMAGSFADVAVHTVEYTERFPSARELWTSLARTMAPVVLMRQKLDPEKWRQIDDAVIGALVKRLGEGPGELTMTAWLTVGIARD